MSMITTLRELRDVYFQNKIIRDGEKRQHRLVGRTGFVTKGSDDFFWTRDGIKFHPFNPNIDAQLQVAVAACQLLYKPWWEQRAYRRQRREAEAAIPTA